MSIRRVSENLGVSPQGQLKKLQGKAWACVNFKLIQVPGDTQAREVAFIALRSLPMWLATIDTAVKHGGERRLGRPLPIRLTDWLVLFSPCFLRFPPLAAATAATSARMVRGFFVANSRPRVAAPRGFLVSINFISDVFADLAAKSAAEGGEFSSDENSPPKPKPSKRGRKGEADANSAARAQ